MYTSMTYSLITAIPLSLINVGSIVENGINTTSKNWYINLQCVTSAFVRIVWVPSAFFSYNPSSAAIVFFSTDFDSSDGLKEN